MTENYFETAVSVKTKRDAIRAEHWQLSGFIESAKNNEQVLTEKIKLPNEINKFAAAIKHAMAQAAIAVLDEELAASQNAMEEADREFEEL